VESDDIPGEDAVALSGLTVGQALTPMAARQAIRALWRTGRVSNVQVLARSLPDGVAVRLALELNQVVRRLDLQYPDEPRQPALERQEVARALGFYAGMAWQPERQEEMELVLVGALAQRGYPAAAVESAILPVPGDSESVALHIRVVQGEPIRISEVDFEGRLGLAETLVRDEFGLRQGDIYDQQALEEGIERLVSLYRREGYYEARVELENVRAAISPAQDENRVARLVVPVEAGSHYRVDFVGNRRVTDQELMGVLRLEEEGQLSRSILDSLAERLRMHYQRLGFYHVRADWRVWDLEQHQRRLAFRVRPGPKVVVQNIRFQGNQEFSDRHLRRQIFAVLEEEVGERGLFRTVSDQQVSDLGVAGEGFERWRPEPRRLSRVHVRSKQIYLADAYQVALNHIRELYSAEGYLSATLSDPLLSFRDRGRLLDVTITVEEGPRTHIRSVSFGGNAALGDEVLTEGLGIDVGQPLNRFEVEQARRRMVSAYQNEGYMFSSMATDEYLSEDRLWADIHFRIEEGEQVRVGSVLVRGNERTRTSLIRDRLRLKPGDIYRPRNAERSERALVELGVFTTASVEMVEPTTSAPVKDVIVEVTERLPQLLEARVGFSTADGPRGALRYGYSNLFGVALGLELRFQLSYQVFFLGTEKYREFVEELELHERLERLVVASLRAPHLPRWGRWLSLRLDATHERDNDPSYAVTKYGLSLAATTGYRPHLSVQVQTGFEFSDIEKVNKLAHCSTLEGEYEAGKDCWVYCSELEPGERQVDRNCYTQSRRNTLLSRSPEDDAWFWVTRALVSLDFRDNPFNPRRGVFASVVAEHVYSLGRVELEGDNGGATAGAEEKVYGASNLMKLSVTLNGYIPLVWLDMVLALSVRGGWIFGLTPDNHTFEDRFFYLGGFDSMRGFPEESMNAQDVAEPGGAAMMNFRAELRIPLPSSFAIGIFTDTGNIWRDETNVWNDFDLRVCVGAGIRYHTPVGPLALDVGFVTTPREEDDADWYAVQFAIGLF
jgi:outer membrane protein assembly factor BamA